MQVTLITVDRPDHPYIGVDVKNATLKMPDGASYAVDFTIVHEPDAPGQVMVQVLALNLEFNFETGPVSGQLLLNIIRHCPRNVILATLQGLVLYITETKLVSKV